MKRSYKNYYRAKNKTYLEEFERTLFDKPYSLSKVLLLHIVVGLLKLLYIMAGIQNLDFEEAQYWTWSKHLDVWYYSKPPMVAYLNWFSTWLFGVHEWSVRINAVALSIFTAVAVYYLALELYKSARLAFYSSVLLLFFPGFVYTSIYFTTDAPLVLFWVLSLLFFWKAVQAENGMKYWLFTALFVGLGLLSKYALLFFYPISFLYLWFYHKEKLTQPGYYICVIISLLSLVPFVVWNMQHNWVGMEHLAQLSGFTGHSNSFVFEKILSRQLEFLGGQLVFNLPILFLLIFRRKYRGVEVISQEADRFLLFQLAFIFLVFFGLAFFKRVDINWLLFAYVPVYIVVAKVFISKAFFKRILLCFSVLAFLFALFFFQPTLALLDIPLSKVMSGKVDPNKKLQGWSNLGLVAQANLDFINEKSPLIFSESYRVAAELSFYMKDNPDVYTLPIPNRRKHQFDIWGIPKKDIRTSGAALLVTINPMDNYGWKSPPENLIHKDSMTLYYKKSPIGTYYFYVLNDFYKVEGVDARLSHY